jgi:hypothetical protein
MWTVWCICHLFLVLLALRQEKKQNFMEFRGWLVAQYQSGAKAVKELSGFDSKPSQQVHKLLEYSTVAKDEGTMQLLDAYIKEHGDPDKNGLGHVKCMAEWKDGTVRECVLKPDLPADQLRVSFQRKAALQHSTCLDDGSVTMDGNQQEALFESLKPKALSQLQGKAMPNFPAPLPDPPKPPAASKAV